MSGITRTFRNLGLAIACGLIFAVILFFVPTVAHAEEPAEGGTSGETPTVEEGSASIDEVGTTGGEPITTEPEIQDALGIPQDTSLNYNNTAAANAIQQAIDAALSYANGNLDITSMTIVVDDGTYAGGLNIRKTRTVTTTDAGSSETTTSEETYNLASNFILQIIAGDARGEGGTLTASAGGAGLDGGIDVDGIDVLIAGLYFVSSGVVRVKSGEVSVYGTVRDDAISVDLCNGAGATVDGGDGNDDIALTGTLGTSMGSGDTSVQISGGSGDDTVTIDTSVARSTGGTVSVNVDGGTGADKLHLAGTLAEGDSRTAGTRYGENNASADIILATPVQDSIVNLLNIHTDSIEAYTDALLGKSKVTLSGSTAYDLTDVQSFTDYIIGDYAGGNLSVTIPAGTTPLLASLQIKKSGNFTVGTISAPAFNIVIEGKGITITGTVTGCNISITASDSDVLFSFGSDDFGSAPLPDFHFEFSLFDFSTNAYIIIEESAALIASETVTLKVTSSQTQPLVPDASKIADLISALETSSNDESNPDRESDASMLSKLKELAVNPNFINVKVGSAVITIRGAVTAAQAIRASAQTTTKMEVTNEDLAKWCIPLGVSVAVAKAEVVLCGNAAVTSTAGGVALSAVTNVTVGTKAATGAIPIALAVSVVVADAHVTVKDNAVISAAGEVTMTATGTVEVETKASVPAEASTGSTGSASKSGGFFAVSVVVQDVSASVTGSASVTAGSIQLTSASKQTVATKAASQNEAENDKEGEEDGSMSLTGIVGMLKSLFGMLSGSGGSEPMVSPEAAGALDSASSQMDPEEESGTGGETGGEGEDDDLGLGNLFGEEEPADAGVTNSFDQGTAGATDTSTSQTSGSGSSAQLVGALAVTYAGNANAAVIKTTGSIIAAGALSASASAEQKIITAADGSPLKEAEGGSGGEEASETTTVTGGTVTTENGDTPGDTPEVTYKAGAEAPVITGGTIGSDGTVAATGTTVVLDGITITITGGKAVIANATGIKKGEAVVTVPADPITITGGTTTVESAKLTLTNATNIRITNGVLTFTGGTVTMEGGTAANTGGTFDIPSSDIEYTNVTISDIESFGAEITNGLAASDLPSGSGLTVTGLKDSAGAAAATPTMTGAKVSGGGAEVTDGTCAFASAGSGITVKIIGGNRSADGSVITAADVEITGATLTISSAYLTLTNGTVTGCKLEDGTDASITGGVIKYNNGTVTITGATIRVSMVRVTVSGPEAGRTIALSGGSVRISDGTATMAVTASPATTASIADGTLTTDPVTPATGKSSFSLGVGISVSVVRNTNTAYIEAGTLACGSLSIKADTSLTSDATAKAGVSDCDIGIAGAVAVHVVSSKTNARLGSAVTVAGGAVELEATQKSSFTTSAEAASSDSTTAKVGVGAGLAIGIIGCDIHAIIPDAVGILLPEGTESIKSLSIRAAYEGTETLKASAGAAGGTSIVPVLALGVSGISTNATLGTGADAVHAAHDVLISADNAISRTMNADAAATGSGVGVGAALCIGVFNDNATAKLNRSVAARNVSVKATAKSSLTSAAKAGASGAAAKEGESSSGGSGGGEGSSGGEDPDPAGGTDQVADRNVQGAGSLSQSSGTNNVNTNSVSGLSANRQGAQTTEGDIKIAAGFALNIQKNVALASIGDGITITATAQPGEDGSGAVAVTSVNKTDSSISANASATQSSIGVGVAVAINIVTYENIAEIGGSAVTAQTLTVTALLPEKPEEEEAAAEDTSLKGKIVTIIKEFVTDILAEMSASIGLDDLFGADVAAAVGDLVEEIATGVIDTMIDDTGLENLFNGDIEQMISEALSLIENLPANAFQIIRDVVLGELLNKIKEMIPGSGAPSDSGMSSLSAALQETATQIVTQLTQNFINIEELRAMLGGSLVETIKTKLTAIAQGALTDIANAAVGILAGWTGDDAVKLYGHTISTEAISGAGASSVGVAGAAAIAVVSGTTRASVIGVASAQASDMSIAGAALIKADATNIIKSAASSSVGDDGKADKNKNAAANANGDTTGGSAPAPTPAEAPVTGADSGGAPASPSTPNSAGSGKSVGVGASFAFNYIHANVEAYIGANRSLTAGTLVLDATLENKVETVAVSGSDPLAGTTSEEDKAEKAKDISVDASVAVGLIYNTVKSYVGAGAALTLAGGSVVNISETEGEEYAETVNLYIHAREKGATVTRASGFTVGNSTAVGAAVAVNIAYSDVSAAFGGTGVVAGAAKILAHTFNQDDSNAIATAMGSDVDRYLSKFRSAQDTAEEKTNKVLEGDYSGADTGNESNGTAGTINGELNNNSNNEQGGSTAGANNNAPLSANAMNTQNTNTENNPDTSEGSGAVSGNASDSSGNPINATSGAQSQQSQKIRVAAAVAVNITIHSASVTVTGSLTAAAVSALARNSGNFETLGTGAAISLDNGGNSIGVGVAVSVNKNEASVTLGGSIAALGDDKYDGDVTADAQLTQNMDGRYKGKLGAQALAGAVTGTGSKFCISAAFAVLVSLSKTTVTIAENASVSGADITASASDKSKLAVRAGGLSLSTGASVGAGISFALIYAHNEVTASVGNGVSITGTSFALSARKLKVDFSDYESAFGLDNMLTHNAEGSDKGIVNIKDTKDENGNTAYQTEISVTTDSVLGFIDLLNFLSSTNYYAESISGAVNTGASGKLTAAGSFAFVFFFNKTEATVGENVSITLTNDMDVTASSQTTARVIAGAVSVSSSQVGIGATVGVIANEDTVTASVGKKGTGTGINVGGEFNMNAAADMDMMLITVAAGASSTGNAIGGSIDVIVSENEVKALVLDGAYIKADGGAAIRAGNEAFLLFVALSAAGSGGKAAVGGTFAVLVTGNSAKAQVGNGAAILSDNGSVTIAADNKETLISVLAAMSGTTGSSPSVAGTLNVQITRSQAEASVGNGTTITAADDINIEASSDTFMLTIVAALTGSAGGAAIGATINVTVFSREVLASVGSGCTLTAASGDIVIRALAEDWLLTITAAGAASGSSVAIAGSIPVVVGQSQVQALVGQCTVIDAGGSVGVIADLTSHIYVPALSFSLSLGSASVGATVNTVVLQNLIEAIIAGGCTITAGAGTAGLDVPNRETRRKGVIVSATGSETMYLISVSGAVSTGSAAIAGVVNTLVVKNTVRAQIRSRLLSSEGEETGEGEHSVQSAGEVLVSAEDDSSILDIAGGVAASSSVGVGATVVVLVYNKDVTASIGSFGSVSAAGAVTVEAGADDELYLFAIAFGAAGNVGVAGGVNVALFMNHVTASAGGSILSQSVAVTADSKITFVNTAAGAAIGGSAGVAAVFVVSYLYSETIAYIAANADIDATGSVTVSATSTEDIYAVVAGGAASGTAGVSGTVDLAITKVVTKAYTDTGVAITAGSLSVKAGDTFSLLGVAGALGGGGTVGIGISVTVVVAFNTVLAWIGQNNTITTTSGCVEVKATSDRDFDAYTVTAGIGGMVGVSGAVSVLVVGSQLTEDTAGVFVDSGGDGRIVPESQVSAAFGQSNPSAQGYGDDAALGDKLESNGGGSGDYEVDGKNFGSGDVDSDDDEEYADDNEEQAGQTTNSMGGAADEAENIGGSAPTYNLKDTTSAYIGAGSVVTSNTDITVEAQDTFRVDMISGAIAFGTYAAVGAGISVAVLNSNVLAYVESGATLNAQGGINVTAKAGSEALASDADQTERKDSLLGSAEGVADVPGITDSTVRVFAVSAGGGLVGVTVSLCAVSLFTNTIAYMAGDVTGAGSLNVTARSDFGRVIAVTLGVSAGGVAVNGSIALVVYQGVVKSAICSAADIRNVTTINVKAYSNTTADAVSTSLGAGGVAVNAAAAIAINLTRVDTFIGAGVRISGATNVTVESDIDSGAEAVILSAVVGNATGSGTVALAILKPTVLTYIGATPLDTPLAESTGSGGLVSAGTVKVKNDVTGDAKAIGISFGASGMGSLNGTVALAINHVTGYAAIYRANVSAGSIDVSALMDGDSDITAFAVTISGGLAFGLIVGIAYIKSDSRALIDITGSSVTATGTISVNAGRDGVSGTGEYDSTAKVDVTTAAVAPAAVSVNVALTINKAGNRALVQGESGTMTAGSLVIYAKGASQAETVIKGVGAGVVNIALSVAVALLQSDQTAALSGGGTYTVGTLTVQSYQNTGKAEDTYDAAATVRAGGGGLVSATAFITIVKADAAGIASAGAASLTVSGVITVQSFGRSYAGASISKADIAGVSVGIMYGRAYAKGAFGAYLGADGANISANGITIYTEYKAAANADVNPATGGFSASYIKVTGNVAQAQVDTVAEAAIVGSGTVTSGGAVMVRVRAVKVGANAVVHAATVNVSGFAIAINISTAQLSAQQSAYILGAVVNTTGTGAAGNVTVLSEYNVTENYADGTVSTPSNNANGAVATVGACGGPSVSVSFVSGDANAAAAISNSSSSAYVKGASTDISGTLRVHAFANSYASADIALPAGDVSLANVTISTTVASAAGSYSAYIDSTGSAAGIKAKAIAINARHNTRAIAKIFPSGSISASISLLSVNGNVAIANASSKASAYFTGSGAIESGSTIDITVSGDALADASVKDKTISISGARVAANTTFANLTVEQKAYLDVSGTVKAAGNITVSAEYDADASHGAKAQTGNPIGASLSILSGQVSMAMATASLVNHAYVTGTGTISCGGLTVNAHSVTRATASADSSFSASLIGVGSLYGYARTSDDVQAYIGNKAVPDGSADITVEAAGDITVSASGDTYATATCDTPGSVSLANVSSARVMASVGTKADTDLGLEETRQTVIASIGCDAVISAGGDISVTAFNTGYATSSIDQGVNVSGISISTCIVQTQGLYDTGVKIGSGAKVTSGGNIVLCAQDYPRARTSVTGTQVGILVQAGNMYAKNTLSQRVLTEIGSDAVISAHGGVSAQAISNANLYAKTNVNTGGIIDAGSLQAYNTITSRDVDLTVGNGVTIKADYGDITLTARSGIKDDKTVTIGGSSVRINDDIYTCATGNSGGLVAISSAKAETKISADTDVTIGAAVTITDTFNTVTIAAYHGEGSVQTIGDFGSGGLSSNPSCRAYINTITSYADVTIANASVTGYEAQTAITGRYIKIYAGVKELYLYAYTNAVAKGLHSTAKAYSTINAYLYTTITIGSAHIKSYDSTEIISSANPTSSGNNIRCYAGTKITAFIGSITSEAIANGAINAKVDIKNGADITGANVTINANRFAGTVSLTATGQRRALATKHTKEENNINRGRDVLVGAGVKFHIGDAAAGIVIDIAENGSVRAVGIYRESTIWTLPTGGTITIFQTIQNAAPGRLYVGGVIALASPIYDQQYIPEITIINHSDYNLVIAGIDSYNETYSLPTVSGPGSKNLMYCSEDTTPVVSIISYGSGDVTIGQITGVVANERGTTNIWWLGETGGSLYGNTVTLGTLQVSALWTHILDVRGAVNIGGGDADRFHAYMAVLYDETTGTWENADIYLDASGDIYASLTLAEIAAVASLTGGSDASAVNGTLYLNDIRAAGTSDIWLPYPVRLKYLAGATSVSLIIPGVLVLTDIAKSLTGDIEIEDIVRYATGYNPADASLGYTLPNGAQVYTDASGRVLRVVNIAGDRVYDLNNYSYSVSGGDLIITLTNENVSLNLRTGELTVLGYSGDESDLGFQVYIGWSTNGGWQLGEGTVRTETRYDAFVGIGEDGEPVTFDITTALWKTVGGVSYYLVLDSASEIWNTSTSHTYYVVAMDGNNVVGVFTAQRTKHETGEVTATISTIVYADTYSETTFALTFGNVAGSGATLTYYKIIAHSGSSTYELTRIQTMSLGLSVISAGSGYYRVADASGLTGAALTAYQKLQGVLWKFNLTTDSNTALKGKLETYTLDLTVKPMSAVEFEDDDGVKHTYDAFVFTRSGERRELTVYPVYIYDADSNPATEDNNFEIDMDNQFSLVWDANSFFSFSIVGGGKITLSAGDSIKLYKSNNIYRLSRKVTDEGTTELYIGSDGTVYFGGVTVTGSGYTAGSATSYNGDTGRFESPEIVIGNTEDLTAGQVTIKAGTIYIELLTDSVAVDAAGRYWYKNGDNWVAATAGTPVVSFEDDDDEDTVADDIRVTTVVIRYNGEIELTITVKEYLNATTPYTVTYHTLPDGFVLGSDGTIQLPADIGETAARTQVTAETNYLVGYIEGSPVIITMESSYAGLRDDDTDDVDIRSEGDVRIRSASGGSIGTADNPLEIAAASLSFENLAGEDRLETSAYIDITEGDVVLQDGQPVTVGGGATVVVNALSGSMSGSDLYVTDAANVTLTALSDILFDHITVDELSRLALTAGNGITVNHRLDVDGSTVEFEAAAGDVRIAAVEIDGGTAMITAGGAIAVTTFAANNSDVDMEAGGDAGIGRFSVSNGSEINILAGGGYNSGIWSADGSTVNITAGGVIDVPDVAVAGSTVVMTAGGNILLDILRGSDSDITLISTGGGIYTANGNSYIQITGAGSKLTLSALEDIGTADVHIRLDIPAEVTLHILHVDDYYIDAMEIPVPDPPVDPVFEGIDETGNPVTNGGEIPNEYVGGIGAETVGVDFDSLSAEQWAQRLMGAMTREQWLALISEGSVSGLILSGGIGAALLSAYLFDNTITPASLQALLAVDPAAPEWQNTLDWLSAVETRLRELLISTEGMTPTKKNKAVITDAMEEALLALFLRNNVVGEIDPALVLTTEEIARLAAQIAQNLTAQAAATLSAVDHEARALHILVGESTGSAYVTNEGDIHITQETGNMTVGLIDSTRGDVSLATLDADEGDIRGADTGAAHIEARNIVLSAAGSIDLVIDEIGNRLVAVYNILDTRFAIRNIGTPELPVIRGRLESDVRYDWLRVYDCDKATRLDAEATGSIGIIEARGDLGIGVIRAGGGVALTAEFGIYDTTDSSETDRNITASSLVMTAALGGIGTADKYIDAAVSGNITAAAQGDIFVTDTGDMTMTADSLTGQVNAGAERDLRLRNTAGDLRLGVVTAGSFAIIVAKGSIVEDDRRGEQATITADGMALEADGVIGTAANPFEVDTGTGTFSATADTLFVTEISGDLKIASVIILGDCVITAPGSILDANGTEFDDALAAQQAANDAQNAADEAYAKASVLQAYADRIKAILDAADLAAQTAQDALDAANAQIAVIDALLTAETDAAAIKEMNKQLKALQDALPGLIKARDKALAAKQLVHDTYDVPWAQAQNEADAAWLAAGALQTAADTAQGFANSLRLIAQGAARTILAGGNLRLAAGGSVGQAGRALSLHANGTVTITAGGDVSIAGGSVTQLGGITAGGSVALTMLGSIIAAAGAAAPVITGTGLDINSLWGDIGEAANPLHVRVPRLSAVGMNLYIRNDGPLTVDEVFMTGSAVIEVNGSVTAGAGGVNITADSLTLTAEGNVGTGSSPLVLNVSHLSLKGKKVYISNISETLHITRLVGGSIVIKASGNVMGSDIYTNSIRINAFGSIGTKENPLGIFTNGSIRLSSEKGLVFFRNLLKARYRKWQQRQLESRYLAMFMVRIPFALRQRGGDAAMAVYIAVGLREDGTWDILGLWIGRDAGEDATDEEKAEAAVFATTILTELAARGVRQIDIAYADGLAGFGEAFEAVFPETTMGACALVWMMNASQQIAEEDREALLAGLNAIYGADTLAGAQAARDEFTAAWSGRYPGLAKQLEDNWQQWSDSFSAAQAARAAGFDLAMIEEALLEMADAVGMRYANDMDPVYAVFIKILKHFPEY